MDLFLHETGYSLMLKQCHIVRAGMKTTLARPAELDRFFHRFCKNECYPKDRVNHIISANVR